MTPERWQQIRDVLEEAQELEPSGRSAFLDRACLSDQSLRQEVEVLLAADDDGRSAFLQSSPPLDGPLERLLANLGGILPGAGLEAGQLFAGRFQLVRKLGEGGMGQVWLAEQTSPVRRQVAVKLIKAGMYDEAVVQRFKSERQSLAIMDHPAIAKVFDAGATPQGQPYFVMEYVPGLPITEYCDRKKLKIADRLELFIQACDGVQHAHQKAIIHRDLKPANTLVVEVDGKPVPRIIDFGLAKGTTPQVEGESRFTQVGHFVGTPGYMSPEQADSNLQSGVHDIDTRTDVYSLGVVLYVLLAGLEPFETRQGRKQPLDELLRKLREEEPPSPSQKVSTDRDASAVTAAARGTEPKQLVSLLRGDLDWIAMKALEKDRARRYGAPSELAADIRRYLHHEPVVARPASAGYRLRKYTRRHRVAVFAAAAFVLLLAAFSVLQAVQLRRITRERDRANRITDFMTGMFKVSDPSEARGNSVTAREILDKASNDVPKGLANDPKVQAQMMNVMAATYANLGLFDRAHELAQQALDVRTKALGPDDPDTLQSMTQVAYLLARQGHLTEAEKLEREGLAKQRRVLGTGDFLTIQTTDNLAVILNLEDRHDESLQLEREAVEMGTRALGAENKEVVRITGNLAVALSAQGRNADAETMFRRVFEFYRRTEGPDAPTTLLQEGNVGVAIEQQGRYAEAEPYYRHELAGEQRVLGPQHRTTLQTMNSLSGVLTEEGRLAEAEAISRQVLATRLRIFRPDHFENLKAKAWFSEVLSREGKFREAENVQRETLPAMTRVLGPEDPYTLSLQSSLARTLNGEGHYADAEKLARGAYTALLRVSGPDDSNTVGALQQLGEALAYTDRYPEGAKLFQDAIAKEANSPTAGQGNPFQLWYAFACVAAAANRPDEAVQYLREAVHRGYKYADALMADNDLKNLRRNPKFQQLVAELQHPPDRDQQPRTQ
jgi:eukaryotic-like serine/threonine-protein kinase